MNNEKIKEILSKPRFHKNYVQHENVCIGLDTLCTNYLTNSMTMVEVGSFAGVSTELFALHVEKVYSVDPYKPYGEIDDQLIIEAEADFINMMVQYNNIEKIKSSSEDACVLFEPESLNFIYIDGAHDYYNVNKDISLWLPKIKKGGYIGGHDGNLVSVNQAITDNGLTLLERFSDTSWIARI